MKKRCQRIISTRKNGFSPSIVILAAVMTLLLLSATVDSGWIDPDTPEYFRSTMPLTEGDTREYELVFSDEFEQEDRTFNDGYDSRWTAINKNDYTNAALHYYSYDNVRTANGVLNITTEQKINSYKAFDEKKKKFYVDQKYIQSGMLQSWNKFCFMGGVVEFSAKLPGDAHKGGLWPALWMLGNLARATYVGSSDYVWPYSYNKCDSRNRKSQAINACARVNHYGLQPFTGRGSPEIDVLEAMQGEAGKLPNTFIQRPYQSASLQIAPGLEIDRPVLGKRPNMAHWYNDLQYSATNSSDLNPFFYGVTLVHMNNKELTYQSDAISANYQLNTTNYEKQHIYRVEWEPPEDDGTGGYIRWFNDGELIFAVDGSSLELMQTEIPREPMYLIMNTAVASSWGFPTPCPDNCECDCFECGNPRCACALPAGYCENFPAAFEIDYVRVYQAKNEKKHILGCSPEYRPTELFIKGHEKQYMAEGQKHSLEPVRSGGGACTKQSECGKAKHMGSCASSGLCVCSANFTGPYCLAHAGFFDFDNGRKAKTFSWSEMFVPKSMIVAIALLLTGFILSLFSTVKAKSRNLMYQRLGDAKPQGPNGLGGVPAPSEQAITSYQDSAAVHYALPPKTNQTEVTYCVIDGRLMDDR